MKSLAFAALACVPVFLLARGEAAPPAAVEETRIGFVDLDEVLNGYAKAKEAIAAAGKALEAEDAELRKREEDLKKRQREVAVLDRSSREFHDRQKSLKAELLALEEDGKWLARQRTEQKVRILLESYDDIRGAIAKAAAAKGLKAVLSIDGAKAPEAEALEERYQRAVARKVLYSSPDLDITSEVTRLLNP